MPCKKFLPLAALIAALWPVWIWISLRAVDDSGDAWELLSLATAVSLLASTPTRTQREDVAIATPMVLLGMYAATYPFLPPLLRAGIAITAVAALCSDMWFGKRMELSLLGLLLLALPVIASLNFYLGYPLRVAVGTAAQALLQMNGFAVIREGTLLNWNGRLISIDAPCSGVKMLWAGLYLSFTLAAFFRLDGRRTLLLGAVAVGIVLLANVMRTTALFFVEAKVMVVDETWHSGIGMTVFVFAALGVAAAAHRFRTIAHVA
jgi:exosortase